MKRYLAIDMERAFGTYKTLIGIIGVCISLLYNSSGSSDVISWIGNLAGQSVLVMAALLFACYPYSAVLCEDMEYCYDRQMVLRGSAFSYAFCKILAVFLSAISVMLTGYLMAVLFLLVKYGLPDAESVQETLDNSMSLYLPVAAGGHYVWFVFCTGFHLAVFAGIIAVIGQYCSLFVKNRMLVYILPMAVMNIENILVQRVLGYEMGSVFSLHYMGIDTLGYALSNHTWNIYYFEMCMLLLALGAAICWKHRKKVA